jgi:hypothetical protein
VLLPLEMDCCSDSSAVNLANFLSCLQEKEVNFPLLFPLSFFLLSLSFVGKREERGKRDKRKKERGERKRIFK